MKKIAFLLFLILVFGCKKEKPITPTPLTPVVNGCPELIDSRTADYPINIVKSDYPQCSSGQEQWPIIGDFGYSDFVVNPSNSSEIAFVRRDLSLSHLVNQNYEIGTYNFCTNVTKILISNIYLTQLDWSSKDWIIFQNGQQIQKMKSNGDSIIPFANLTMHDNVSIRWSPDGTKFIAKSVSSQKNIIYNEFGELVQICPFYVDRTVWLSNEEIIIFQPGSGFVLYHIYNQTLQPWSTFSANEIGWLYRIKNEKLYYSNSIGVYEISDNSYQLLDPYYETYFSISFQPLGGDLFLVQRNIFDSTEYIPCKYNTRQYLGIFNRSTQTEKMIQIP